MKKRFLLSSVFMFMAVFMAIDGLSQTVVDTRTTTGIFNEPGVSTITVECWGGGGSGGGTAGNSDGGGGGGGGGYCKATLPVTPSTNYTVTVGGGGATGGTGVGNAGQPSWFGTMATILANGGAAGNITTGTGGPGGAGGALGTVTGTSTFRSTGGNGGRGRDNTTGRGGPGGSSGGTAANGTSGPTTWSTQVASAAPTGGGKGGNGGLENTNGNTTGAPGIGGGGGGGGEAASGGAGASGQVTITYVMPDVNGLSASGATICAGSGTVVTVSSSNLLSGTYTVTYTVSGTNTIASTTATLTFTSGTPGTGTFTTSNLTNAGAANVVNITRVTNSVNNFRNVTVSTAAFTTTSGIPATPGTITGSTPVCPSTAGLIYSIAAVPNATSYTWTVPTGWSITGGQGTTSVTVTSGTNGQNGTITVTASNVCGTSSAASKTVASATCTITAVSSGNWNTPSTWSCNCVPDPSNNVLIPSGRTVTISNTVLLFLDPTDITITVNGTLILQTATLSIDQTDQLIVNTGGQLVSAGLGTIVSSGFSFPLNPFNFPSGTTMNGPFAVTGGALPITLLYFKGRQVNDQVLLEWASATEENFDYYRVEKSTDGKKFEELNRVNGSKVSTSEKKYSLIDPFPVSHRVYYKLVSVDLDGKSEYFETIAIDFSVSEKKVFVYPNPVIAGNELIIQTNFESSDEDVVAVHNMLGQLILQIPFVKGEPVSLDTKSWGPGFYLVTVYSRQGRFVEKIVLR